jgi:purine-nucleoside phosphorylase
MSAGRAYRNNNRFTIIERFKMNKLDETVKYVRHKSSLKPSIGIILGSGLGGLSSKITKAVKLPYKTLPHFVRSTVPWHEGSFILGKLFGQDVAVMSGRFHSYEGYTAEEITYPVRVMKKLGIKKLVVTNAAGSLNENFLPGDLMIIADHINLLDTSSLYKASLMKKQESFIDASNAYSEELILLTLQCSVNLGVRAHQGVYVAVKGPAFETAAEARMLRLLGADAVGMSTIPEVLIAKYLGLDILGISCITNTSGEKFLTHQKVVKIAKDLTQDLTLLIKELFKKI